VKEGTMSKVKYTEAAKQKASKRPDPTYVILRLRGLARLVFHASCDEVNAEPINSDAAFFISTELEAMADTLSAQ
jgi:hypothetical protein